MFKKLLFLSLVILFGFAADICLAKYSGGNGSESNPYRISNAYDMNDIGANPNDWDKHFVLTNDIDLAQFTGTEFNIIAPGKLPSFTGVFDGNGFTISNFTYNSTGIFGYVGSPFDPEGEIKNLVLIDPNVNAGEVYGWGDHKLLNGQKLTDAVRIAAGDRHSLAIKSDGSIMGWGQNDQGQCISPGGNDYIDIAGGRYQTIALRAGGTIVEWGSSYTAPDGNDFIAVAAGYYHSLALRSDGSIEAWGNNDQNQTTVPDGNDYTAIAAGRFHNLFLKSDGSIEEWNSDYAAPEGNDFVAIAAGYRHSLALRADGSIEAWGYDFYGQATAPDGNDFVAISVGTGHSLALRADGSVLGWGYDRHGQATAPDGNDFIAIAAGSYHSMVLKADGTVISWGHNSDAQSAPPAGSDYVAITAGSGYSLALKTDGTITRWGHNAYNQVVYIPDGNNFTALAAGEYHNLALKSNGSIIGWGHNNKRQAEPPFGNDFVAISAGEEHSLALKTNGSIVAWGNNNAGQTRVPAGNDFVAISAGYKHNLALRSDGSIVGWGWNYYGQATPPDGNDFIAISTGAHHNLALKADGTIIAWGKNFSGQAETPDGNDFIAISGGKYHSLALRSDGSILAWGNTPQITGKGFFAIAAGGYHSVALKGPNLTPVAIAGPDQIAYADYDGTALLALDGSNSYDPDGDILTYNWLLDSNTIAAGVNPTVELPVGTHTIELIVNDGSADSEPNETTVTVIAPLEVPMHFTPRMLNPKSKGKWVKAHLVLPEGFAVGDVNTNSPAKIVEPFTADSNYMDVFINEDGLVKIMAAFDRAVFCSNGSMLEDIVVIAQLTTGQYFYGTDTIRIKTNNLEYLAVLTSYWLAGDCGEPDWCAGADLNRDSVVDFIDFAFFDGCCLEFIKK